MKQQNLAAQSTFEKYGRKSRRELFLDEMEVVVPRMRCVAAAARLAAGSAVVASMVLASSA